MTTICASAGNEKFPPRRVALRGRALVLAAGALLSTCFSASAHHGTSVTYDLTKTITLTGTVTEWDFVFPHPALYFDVTNAGKVEHWGAETGASPSAYLAGKAKVNRNSIKAGDKLKITCYPHRTATAKACLVKGVVVNDKVLEGLDFKPAQILQNQLAPASPGTSK